MTEATVDEDARAETAGLVLLVEDSPTQALRTQAVLTAGGFDVKVCGSGGEALNCARSRQPDLILLDMNLPDVDGRTVALRLKEDPTSAGIPIIFLTGVFREVEDLIEALEQGGDDYLVKPVEDGELLARVRASVRARRTQHELSRLVRLLLSVNHVGNELGGILDRAALLDNLVELIKKNFDYSYVTVFGVHGGDLVREATAGPAAGRHEGISTIPLRDVSASLVAAAFAAGGSRSWNADEPGPPPTIDGMGSAIAVPFSSSGGERGVLEVVSAERLAVTEHDHLALSTLADLLGMAVHNAQLYRQMEELALVDGLTGLPNRRAIMGQLEGEFERARRYHRALTLLSVDVDTFKQINDTHGHPAGDRALVALAEVIRQATRRVDLSGRFGGDEFLVVLPETDQERALVVAERLRAACDALELRTDSGDAYRLTVSVGIASLPETQADYVADLLAAVDQALYRAKAAGRNAINV